MFNVNVKFLKHSVMNGTKEARQADRCVLFSMMMMMGTHLEQLTHTQLSVSVCVCEGLDCRRRHCCCILQWHYSDAMNYVSCVIIKD